MYRMNSSNSPHSSALGRVLATVSVGFVVTQLDVTIVNIALPKIGADLHANVAGLQWVVDAYTLAFAVLMLSAGALGDGFGGRRLYAAGIVLFALASLACGLALDAAMLVAARALQGIGAAAMLPNSLALLNQSYGHDPKLRARAVGLWTAAGAIAIAAGPVAGGLLIAAFGWRSIFLVNLPICAAGFLATLLWLPRPEATTRQGLQAAAAARSDTKPRGIDLSGQCLAIVALTAFVAAVNLTYYGMVFVLSLYLQRVRGYTPLQAGLAFLPLTGGFLLSNVASGWVVGRFGVRVPMIAGAITAGLGYGLLHFVDAGTPLIGLLLPFLLIPSGMGLAVPAMTTAVLASTDAARAGTASAVLNTARQAGGAVGVAAFGALASGAAATQIVAGMRASTAVSIGLLVIGGVLSCFVHPQPQSSDPARRPACREPAGESR
jgi:DHA2 family methylenomycin A resistance protein-like MFS transporter